MFNGWCTNQIPDANIKELLPPNEFQKFNKFKKRWNFSVNTQKGFIPCVYPDCENWVKYKDGDEQFVTCEAGHEFCAKCKERWHRSKNCKNVK